MSLAHPLRDASIIRRSYVTYQSERHTESGEESCRRRECSWRGEHGIGKGMHEPKDKLQ